MDRGPTRVAFDVGSLAGPRTGVGTAVQFLSDALADDPTVDLVPYLTSFRARLWDDVRRLRLPAAVAHRLWSRTDHPRVDRWVGDVDVVHGTNYVVPPSRRARLVSVYDCWFLKNPDDALPDVRRAGRVLTRAIEHGATVHASSHATGEAVREIFPGARVEVVRLAATPLPPPVDTPPVAELVGVDYVLALGTLERRKNLPRLVEAFALAASELPDVRLVLAGGDGDARPAIDAAIDAAGPDVASRILLVGWVDDVARAWLLRHAAVLAYPSLDEGFGFPLLDAMQAEVPIVASTAGSIPEVAGGAALLAAPDDVVALAAALRDAITSTSTRARLATAAQQQLKEFSWSATASAMAALYRELAS